MDIAMNLYEEFLKLENLEDDMLLEYRFNQVGGRLYKCNDYIDAVNAIFRAYNNPKIKDMNILTPIKIYNLNDKSNVTMKESYLVLSLGLNGEYDMGSGIRHMFTKHYEHQKEVGLNDLSKFLSNARVKSKYPLKMILLNLPDVINDGVYVKPKDKDEQNKTIIIYGETKFVFGIKSSLNAMVRPNDFSYLITCYDIPSEVAKERKKKDKLPIANIPEELWNQVIQQEEFLNHQQGNMDLINPEQINSELNNGIRKGSDLKKIINHQNSHVNKYVEPKQQESEEDKLRKNIHSKLDGIEDINTRYNTILEIIQSLYDMLGSRDEAYDNIAAKIISELEEQQKDLESKMINQYQK